MKMKRISNASKMVAMTAALGSMMVFSSANASVMPSIESFVTVAQHSVTLDVKDPDLKGSKGRIKVLYQKDSAKSEKIVTKKVTFDSNGEAKVKIKGLKANTTYNFKVEAVAAKSGSKFSGWSQAKGATTAK